MSGQEGARGYLLQAVTAVLDSFEDNWESICVEPKTEDDKVDIKWTYADSSEKVCQVKSSINPFEKANVLKWMLELYKDYPEASNYKVALIGTNTKSANDLIKSINDQICNEFKGNYKELNSINNKINVICHPLDIKVLNKAIAADVSRFLSSKGIVEPSSSHQLIAKGLVLDQFELSTKGEPLTRIQFENKLLEWITSKNYVNRNINLSFYLSGHFNFTNTINAIKHGDIEKSEYFEGRKENLLSQIENIKSFNVVENFIVSDSSSMFLESSIFQKRKTYSLDYKNEPVVIDSEDKLEIKEKVKKLLGRHLSNYFFGFGDLTESRNTVLTFPSRSKYTFRGNLDEKEKYKLYRKFIFDLEDTLDLQEYWEKMRGFYFLPIVLKNEGTSHEQDLKIRLVFPNDVNVIKPDDFPMPKRYEVIKDFNRLDSHFSSLFKHHKDLEVEEYQSNKNLYSRYDELKDLVPSLSIDEKEFEKDRYYEILNYIFDYRVFDNQKNGTVLECQIDELNSNEVISLPSFIFVWCSKDFSIEYEINYKNLPKKINGTLDVNVND